jgi:hypothetical protein
MRRFDPEIERILNSEPVQIGIPILTEVVCVVINQRHRNAGLLGVSPYVTKWMLFQRFAHGVEAPGPDHNRLDWGTKMEPLLLEQAAADFGSRSRPTGSPTARKSMCAAGCSAVRAMPTFTIRSAGLARSKPNAASTTKS